jgi:hypothetical protein
MEYITKKNRIEKLQEFHHFSEEFINPRNSESRCPCSQNALVVGQHALGLPPPCLPVAGKAGTLRHGTVPGSPYLAQHRCRNFIHSILQMCRAFFFAFGESIPSYTFSFVLSTVQVSLYAPFSFSLSVIDCGCISCDFA